MHQSMTYSEFDEALYREKEKLKFLSTILITNEQGLSYEEVEGLAAMLKDSAEKIEGLWTQTDGNLALSEWWNEKAEGTNPKPDKAATALPAP